MLAKQMAEFLLNEHDSIIYVTGKEDYRLEFMNAKAKEFFGLDKDDTSYLGQTCYNLFFGCDTPCEFCTRPILNHDDFYRYETYNDKLKEHFYHRTKFITIEGKEYYFKITDVYTDRIQRQLETEHQLETQNTLLRCIRTLTEEPTTKAAITSLLQIVAEYYKADRAYLFEIDHELQEASNTYEWVRADVSAEIDNMQRLPLSIFSHWIEIFKKQQKFYLSKLEEQEHLDSETYALLQNQNIQSLMAVPLIAKGTITGFIGVDNPRQNYNDFMLLSSVTHFILNDLEKRSVTEQLKNLSFTDSLTGLYNRNRYNHMVSGLLQNPPSVLGIIYLDLNGLKKVNDQGGHSAGDNLLRRTAQILLSLFRDDTYRIGGDEFVVLLPRIPKFVFDMRIEKLRQKFQEADILISLGSCWRDHNVNILQQVKEADRLMYEEKKEYYRQRL